MRNLAVDQSVKNLVRADLGVTGRGTVAADTYLVMYLLASGDCRCREVTLSAASDRMLARGHSRHLVRYTTFDNCIATHSPTIYKGDNTTIAVEAFRRIAWTLGANYRVHDGATDRPDVSKFTFAQAVALEQLNARVTRLMDRIAIVHVIDPRPEQIESLGVFGKDTYGKYVFEVDVR